MSTLSPLQLIAGSSIVANAGISVNSDLTNLISEYRSTDLIKPLADTLSNPQLLFVAAGLVPTLITLTAESCPALSDSTPAAFASQIGIRLDGSTSSGNSINGFTSIIPTFGFKNLGDGDNTKFVQAFVAAQAYISTTNQFVLAVENSNSYLGSSFTNMNNLITGSLSEVNSDFLAFGKDLQALGSAISLENLSRLGSPLSLLQQILNFGLTSGIAAGLEQNNIDIDTVVDVNQGSDNLLITESALEKKLYNIFTQITDNELAQVLQILNVSTPNIQRLSDLLNPVKIFPNSFSTLTVKTVDGIQHIYLNNQGAVNTALLQTLPEYIQTSYVALAAVIPPDQALANQALKVSLQQIKNIFNLTLADLAASYLSIKSTGDLPLVNALTTPVPASVIAYYREEFSSGAGVAGTLTVADFFGASSGTGFISRIRNTLDTFKLLKNNLGFTTLSTAYERMNNTLNGVYGNPVFGPIRIPPGPGAGRYNAIFELVGPEEEGGEPVEVLVETAGSVALRTGLIPAITTSVTQITATAPSLIDSLNKDWQEMAEKLLEESNNQEAASIDLSDLIPNDKTAVLNFIQNLPSYGEDTAFGGTADFLEAVANKNTLGGQAIVA